MEEINTILEQNKQYTKTIRKIFNKCIEEKSNDLFLHLLKSLIKIANKNNTLYLLDKILENNPNALSLCVGYNKLILDGVILSGNPQDIYLNYYNGTLAEPSDILGVYLNNKKIITGASYDTKVVAGVFDNLLFIKTISLEGNNVRVFNEDGRKI